MYVQHFGLERAPFSIAPDPRFLFMSQRHREALAHLLFGLEAGGGFVLLTGDIGAGKTTVCRAFLEQVPSHCQVAYIFNPRLSVVELLTVVCEEFGIALPGGEAPPSVRALVEPLNRFLLDAHAADRNCVLVIDEAQQLSPEVLEQLRLLTNLETSERKLLQIVLIGQPELRVMLAQPGLEQLAQRVIARYHLGPLNLQETGQYVQHRLLVAGLRGPSPLAVELLPRIHRQSGGVPRRINLLCDRALLGAYGKNMATVDRATLKQAIDEVAWEGAVPSRAWPLPARVAGSAVLALSLVAAGAWGVRWMGPQPAGDAAARVAHGAGKAGTGAASAPTASAAATPAGPASAALVRMPGLEGLLKATADEATARAALAGLWGVTVSAAPVPACSVERIEGLLCLQSTGGTDLLRRLDRPALLKLSLAGVALSAAVSESGSAGTEVAPVRWALLTALSREEALFEVAGQRVVVPLVRLAEAWRGEFITYWRAPEGYPARLSPLLTPSLADWLDTRLPPFRLPGDASLKSRLVAFQVSEGLQPDGLPGPMTMMALNRRAGLAEPRLQTLPAPP